MSAFVLGDIVKVHIHFVSDEVTFNHWTDEADLIRGISVIVNQAHIQRPRSDGIQKLDERLVDVRADIVGDALFAAHHVMAGGRARR